MTAHSWASIPTNELRLTADDLFDALEAGDLVDRTGMLAEDLLALRAEVARRDLLSMQQSLL